MDLKTKRKISLFGILAYFLILCAAGVYVYFQVEKGNDFFLPSFIPIFAIMVVPLYYFGKGKETVRQTHKGVQILITMGGWAAYFLIWIYQIKLYHSPVFAIDDSATAFVWFWIYAAVFFFVGFMLAIGSYHADDIVDFFKRRKD